METGGTASCTSKYPYFQTGHCLSASLSILSTSLIFRQGSDNWSSTGSRQSSRWNQRFLEGVVAAGDDGDNFDCPLSALPYPSLCCKDATKRANDHLDTGHLQPCRRPGSGAQSSSRPPSSHLYCRSSNSSMSEVPSSFKTLFLLLSDSLSKA